MVRHHRQVPAAWILVGCRGDRPFGVGQRSGRPVDEPLRAGTVRCADRSPVGLRLLWFRPLVLAMVPSAARSQRSGRGPGQVATRRSAVRLLIRRRRFRASPTGIRADPFVGRGRDRFVVDKAVRVRSGVRIAAADEVGAVTVHQWAVGAGRLPGVVTPLVARARGGVFRRPAVGTFHRAVCGGGPARLLVHLGSPAGFRTGGRGHRRAAPVVVAASRLGASARPVRVRLGFALATSLWFGSRVSVVATVRVTPFGLLPGVPLRAASRVPVRVALVAAAIRVAWVGKPIGFTLVASIDIPVRVTLVASWWCAGTGALRAEVRPDDPVATPGGLTVRRAPSVGPRPFGPGVGRHRPVVR
ncbi:hypothetical protein SAMN05216284_101123 [Micromonospora sediminimaris]|nr:hypothetical protein SAMN05216284_101123 [Micromonospora sediminimaris]